MLSIQGGKSVSEGRQKEPPGGDGIRLEGRSVRKGMARVAGHEKTSADGECGF
jgi:hypothetical protein